MISAINPRFVVPWVPRRSCAPRYECQPSNFGYVVGALRDSGRFGMAGPGRIGAGDETADHFQRMIPLPIRLTSTRTDAVRIPVLGGASSSLEVRGGGEGLLECVFVAGTHRSYADHAHDILQAPFRARTFWRIKSDFADEQNHIRCLGDLPRHGYIAALDE